MNNGAKFVWTLYSDGTANKYADGDGAYPKTWWFGSAANVIVIRNIAPNSPKDGFIDTCTIHWNGQGLDAKNNVKGSYTGRRID